MVKWISAYLNHSSCCVLSVRVCIHVCVSVCICINAYLHLYPSALYCRDQLVRVDGPRGPLVVCRCLPTTTGPLCCHNTIPATQLSTPPPLVPHHSLYQLHGHPTDNTNCLWIKGKKDESAAATAPDSPSILAPLVPPAAHQQHLTESRGAIWHQPGASDSFHLNASKYTSSSSSSPSSSS